VHLRERSVLLSGRLRLVASSDCMYSAGARPYLRQSRLAKLLFFLSGRQEDCRTGWEGRQTDWMVLKGTKSKYVVKLRYYLMALHAPVSTAAVTIFEPLFALRQDLLPAWSPTTLCSLRLWLWSYSSQS
jgi:hypothetical protein